MFSNLLYAITLELSGELYLLEEFSKVSSAIIWCSVFNYALYYLIVFNHYKMTFEKKDQSQCGMIYLVETNFVSSIMI